MNDYYNYLDNYESNKYMPMNGNINYQSMMPYPTTIPEKINSEDKANIYTSYEGFKRGNMFSDLYGTYKDYKPLDITPSNERDDILFKIEELNFALIDIGLYLDINPNNHGLINLFNEYQINKKKLESMYEKKYGPLTFDSTSYQNNWSWDNSPWPWECDS